MSRGADLWNLDRLFRFPTGLPWLQCSQHVWKMYEFGFWLGVIAAALTSLSYWPQVRKALPRGATKDLSVKTLTLLTLGLVCWVTYGALRHDWIILIANAIGASLSATTLVCKLRDMKVSRHREESR